MDDPSNFTLVSVAYAGTCLGVTRLDMGQSNIATVWAIVQSRVAQVARLSKDTFDYLMRDWMSSENQITRGILSQNKLFNNLSEQTQSRIIFNGRTKKYEPNDLVMSWHPRSPWPHKGT
jgi:hypothetical protein